MHLQRTVTILTIAAGLVAGGVLSCSAKTPAEKKDAAHQSAAAVPAVSAVSADSTALDRKLPDRTILFFMNPNGHPCRMQKAIIDGMGDKLSGLARVTYVKITEADDRPAFEKYGIRGLPSLILVDAQGNELYRFATGIQDEETILAALQKKSSGQ